MLLLVSYTKRNDGFQTEIMECTAFILALKCKIRRLTVVVYRTVSRNIVCVFQCREPERDVLLFFGI